MNCLVNNRSYVPPPLTFDDPSVRQKKQFHSRSYTVVGKLQGIIASFCQKEPQLAADTVDYIMNRCITEPVVYNYSLQQFKRSTRIENVRQSPTSTRKRRSSQSSASRQLVRTDNTVVTSIHSKTSTKCAQIAPVSDGGSTEGRHGHETHINAPAQNGNALAHLDSQLQLQNPRTDDARASSQSSAPYHISPDDPFLHKEPLKVVSAEIGTNQDNSSSSANVVHAKNQVHPSSSHIATDQCAASVPVAPRALIPTHRIKARKIKQPSTLSVAAQQVSSSLLRRFRSPPSAPESEHSIKDTYNENTDHENLNINDKNAENDDENDETNNADDNENDM